MDWDASVSLRGRTNQVQETSERKKRLRNKRRKGVLVIKREFIHKQRSPQHLLKNEISDNVEKNYPLKLDENSSFLANDAIREKKDGVKNIHELNSLWKSFKDRQAQNKDMIK